MYLIEVATSLESVNLSTLLLGKIAASTRVNNPEVDDNTFTIPASVSRKASWYDRFPKKNCKTTTNVIFHVINYIKST